MVFNSVLFLFFFLVVFHLYWWLPKKYQWLFLLTANYYFYLAWKPAYGLILLLTTVITYATGMGMSKYADRKKLILFIGVSISALILFIFKYLNFFSLSLDAVFSSVGVAITLPQFKLLLPVGISFYVFQSVSYLVDIYRGKIKAEKHLGYVALYLSFFPTVLSGPIERAGNLIPQLKKVHTFEYSRVTSGLKLFTLGLFKKVVVADNLATAVDAVFGNLDEFKGLSLVLTIFFFSWQIYADFSGYTDMARGIARILGYDLVENFNTPYLATSIRDFWRRWHISLSSWFKDYLYIPLGGNRKGLVRTCLHTVLVFVICGLWHGAALTYIVWGALHGIYMMVERVYEYFFKGRLQVPQILSHFYTYSLVCLAWIFFRAPTIQEGWYVLRYALVGLPNFVRPDYIYASISQIFKTNVLEMLIVAFALISIIVIDQVTARGWWRKLITEQPVVLRWTIYLLVIMTIILLRNAEIKDFIYFQF